MTVYTLPPFEMKTGEKLRGITRHGAGIMEFMAYQGRSGRMKGIGLGHLPLNIAKPLGFAAEGRGHGEYPGHGVDLMLILEISAKIHETAAFGINRHAGTGEGAYSPANHLVGRQLGRHGLRKPTPEI